MDIPPSVSVLRRWRWLLAFVVMSVAGVGLALMGVSVEFPSSIELPLDTWVDDLVKWMVSNWRSLSSASLRSRASAAQGLPWRIHWKPASRLGNSTGVGGRDDACCRDRSLDSGAMSTMMIRSTRS